MPLATQWLPSPNYDKGRGGKRVQWVILHTTEGGFTASVNWLRNPGSQASAHYVVGRDDPAQPVQVVQLVKEEDTAWTAGNYAINQASVNIEMAGYSQRNPPVDEETLQVTAALVREVCNHHGIAVQRVTREEILRGVPGIAGHVDVPNPNNPALGGGVAGHTDPGPVFPWERFLELVRGSGGETVQDPNAVVQVGPFGCHLGGGFRRFWEERGGVAIFGYPITEEIQENGVTVQYFERARFEHRPDIGRPEDYHVVLGRVGAELLEAQRGQRRSGDAERLVSSLQLALSEVRDRLAVVASLVGQLEEVVRG